MCFSSPKFKCFSYVSTQQVQFAIILVHALQLLFIECNYPIAFAYVIMSYAVLFLTLFSNFFLRAYVLKVSSRTSLKYGNKIEKDQ